jgi:DNA-binding transcriptional ArsR family regulator
MKKLLHWLPFSTRGSKTRIRIIERLRGTPSNINQLAGDLSMDYKSISHHIDILKGNSLITQAKPGYGAVYFLSDEMEANYKYVEDQILSVKNGVID